MPSRLAAAFAAARGTTSLVPYLTAGYPDPDASLAVLERFAASGAVAIEVGIPFSDPIADGPDLQRAAEAALRHRIGALETLELIARFRARHETPVVVMTYFNPVLRTGVAEFAAGARDAGADGVLVSDLPPSEAPEAWEAFDRAGLDTVVLVAPTTPEERLDGILARARGFLYCLARTGVTGAGGGEAGALDRRLAALRRRTALPLGVGFGIATAAEAARLRGAADAVIVGAAFARAIAAAPERAAERAGALAAELAAALR